MPNVPTLTQNLFFSAIKKRLNFERPDAKEDVSKQLKNAAPFVALLGPSGSGKSHFIEHELVPSLNKLQSSDPTNEGKKITGAGNQDSDEVKSGWKLIKVNPQANPIGLLACKLAQPGKLKPTEATDTSYAKEIEDKLRSGNEGITDIVETSGFLNQSRNHLLIVVDELEALFRFKDNLSVSSKSQQQALRKYFKPGDDVLFFNLLLQAVKSDLRIFVLFSLGTESISHLNQYQEWPELISLNRYSLKPIKTATVREFLLSDLRKERSEEANNFGNLEVIIDRGISQIYGRIIKDFQQLEERSTDLLARTNFALWLIGRKSLEFLHQPFEQLKSPPGFIKRALTAISDKTSELKPANHLDLKIEPAPSSAQEEQQTSPSNLGSITKVATGIFSRFSSIFSSDETSADPSTEKELKEKRNKLENTQIIRLENQRLKDLFSEEENYTEWNEYYDQLSNAEQLKFNKAVGRFFQKLESFYTNQANLKTVFNHIAEDIYGQFSATEKECCKRLFQALTIKDSRPGNVAIKHPMVFAQLLPIVNRSGLSYTKETVELFALKKVVADAQRAFKDAGNRHLQKVIDAFSLRSAGAGLPSLISQFSLTGLPSSSSGGGEETIVDVESTSLLNSWSALNNWVEEEVKGANLHKELFQRTQLNEADHAVSTTDEPVSNGEETSEGPKFNFFKEAISLLKSVVSPLTSGKAKGADEELKTNATKDATFLSEGRLELCKEWLGSMLPNGEWAERYAAVDQVESTTEPNLQVQETAVNEFRQVEKFMVESKRYRNQIAASIKEADRRKIQKANFFTKIVLLLLVVAIGFVWYGKRQSNKAKAAVANMQLLDFAGTLANAHVIPDDIYRSATFLNMKKVIEDDPEMVENVQVLKFLADSSILFFRQGAANNRHADLSYRALLQLDTLVGLFHRPAPQNVLGLTNSVLETVENSMRYSSAQADTAFQFPYVYQAMSEVEILLKYNGAKVDVNTSPTTNDNIFYQEPARIKAIASNPVMKNQIAFADGSGRVKVYVRNQEVNGIQPINEDLSAMVYSRDGLFLFVSTFTGDIYRYNPLMSSVNAGSPLGFQPVMEAQPLVIDWDKQKSKKAILSILNTDDPRYLLVQGDEGVSLLLKNTAVTANLGYFEVHFENVLKDIKSINVITGDPTGQKFLIGGSEGSCLMEIIKDARGMRSIACIEKISHPNISVTAVTFDVGNPGKLAIGTATGQIYLTNLNDLDQLEEASNKIRDKLGPIPYQSSAITGLEFNKTFNRQLISSSMDGTVWLFNLDLVSDHLPFYPLENLQPTSATWDHLKLEAEGRSVGKISLVNSNWLMSVENNVIRRWATHLQPLYDELLLLRADYQEKHAH